MMQAAAEVERLHVRAAAAEAEAAQLRGALDAGMHVHEQEAEALEALEAGAREELAATHARARASLVRAAVAEAKLAAAEAALAAAEKVSHRISPTHTVSAAKLLGSWRRRRRHWQRRRR
jgi:hypothetical protein